MLAVALVAGCASRATPLRIGAAAEEPAPTVAGMLATVLTDGGFEPSIVYFERSSGMIEALADGTIDAALMEEPLQPVTGVVTLLPIYPSVLHILRRKGDSPGMPQLLEGAVYAGPTGSLGRVLATKLAAEFQMRIRLLDNPWSEPPDGYFVFGGVLPQDAMRQLAGFELVGLESTHHPPGEALVDAITLRFPSLRPFTIPADLYPALSHEPVRTLGATTFLVARNDLGDQDAYRIAQVLTENSRPLRSAYPLAHATSIKTMNLDNLALPLHRGARRYIERDLPSFIERYVEVIALITTLLMATASGVFGWLHRRKRTRKERVDTQLIAVLALRARMRSGEAGDWRAELDLIEKDVLELVVTEQVEIGAGLIAFLQLCASLRADLTAPTEPR